VSFANQDNYVDFPHPCSTRIIRIRKSSSGILPLYISFPDFALGMGCPKAPPPRWRRHASAIGYQDPQICKTRNLPTKNQPRSSIIPNHHPPNQDQRLKHQTQNVQFRKFNDKNLTNLQTPLGPKTPQTRKTQNLPTKNQQPQLLLMSCLPHVTLHSPISPCIFRK
jgi:hypothetical protein